MLVIASSIFPDKSPTFDSTFFSNDPLVSENPVSRIALPISSHFCISLPACEGVVGIIFETGIVESFSNHFATTGRAHPRAAFHIVDARLVFPVVAISVQAPWRAPSPTHARILVPSHALFPSSPVGHGAAIIIAHPHKIFHAFTHVLYAGSLLIFSPAFWYSHACACSSFHKLSKPSFLAPQPSRFSVDDPTVESAPSHAPTIHFPILAVLLSA